MGGGLLVLGAAGYGFVALAGHTLSPADAAPVDSFYLLINIIGPGVFAALEQETNRAVSARLAAGGDVRPVGRNATKIGIGLLVAVVVVLAAVGPVLVPTALGGQWALFVALLLGTATAAMIYLARGLLGGQRRFGGYAATLAVEGLARLLPCVIVALSGGATAGGYALLFAAGSALGAAAGLPALRTRPAPVTSTTAGPAVESTAGMARATAVLAGSTLLAQLVANLAPVVVAARLGTNADANTATAATFASAFVLVRIPLFVFAPVQAMLLPRLTAAATRRDRTAVRNDIRRVLLAVGAVGAAGALASLLIGPWAVRVLFGAHVALSGSILGALGLGTLALMAAQVLQPGLVALDRHRSATVSWLLGSALLTGGLFLPGDPVHTAVLAQVAGSGLVAVGMGLALVGALREQPR
jgi:O-antigen/teichoic acid export membrane protein